MPSGTTVAEVLTNNIATIGENQNLRRAKRLEVSQGAVVSYVHNQQAPGLGKIGVLVALEGSASDEVLQALGKQIAQHVAAAFPLALDEHGLDPAVLERERAIATEKAQGSGKPADIIAKMVEGGVKKFAKENALLSQPIVHDGKTPVADVVAKAAKDAGQPIKLVDYVRFQLGEGIEREANDFAAEVAAASGVPQKSAEPTPETEPTA
jgi:elongation factor Ts